MREIEIASFGDDMPSGQSVEDACYEATKDMRAERVQDAYRLKKLRDEACHPGCECKQCKATNLRERREITNKWRMPDES